MSDLKKINEGNEFVKCAEKSLKMGILKWKPDYDSAADYYTKAATSFRLAKDYEKSKDCFMKALECHKNNHSWFHAGKCYEQIILILKETNAFLEIEQCANKACNLYQQHGSPEAAALTLDKAAKMVEPMHPDIALRFYQHALEIVMIEDSLNRATEYASKISRIFVKLKLYDEAADALGKEIYLNTKTESYGHIGRLTVALVLVHLARGDNVAAEKSFKEYGNCCDPQECQTLEMLLQAFDDEDTQAAKEALSSPFIRHMDVEYSVLARDIALHQGIIKEPSSNVKESVSAEEKANKESDFSSINKDLEDEEDLC